MHRPDYRAGRTKRAVKVYTVCDESRFLVVKNVPALGCTEDLEKLLGLYGDIEESADIGYWMRKIVSRTQMCTGSNMRSTITHDLQRGSLTTITFLGIYLMSPMPLTMRHCLTQRTSWRKEDVYSSDGLLTSRVVSPEKAENQGSIGWLPQLEGSAFHSIDSLSGHASGLQEYPNVPSDRLPRTSEEEAIDMRDNLQDSSLDHLSASKNFQSQEFFLSASMNGTVQLVRDKLNKISDVSLRTPERRQELNEQRPLLDTKGKRPNAVGNHEVISKKRHDNRKRI